jgi:hypothetical protein
VKIRFILALAIVATMAGCKKEEEEVPTTADKLNVYLNHIWIDGPFVYNQEYTVGGIPVKFQDFRYFLSNFEVHDDDGNEQEFDLIILADASSNDGYTLGDLTHSHVHEMYAALGLDEETNHQDPTAAAAPLDDITMHWFWEPEQGYKFIRIEGEADADMDGTFEPFSVHAATDELYRSMDWMIHETAAGGKLNVNVTVDLYKFLQNVDFSQALSGTHGSSDLTNGIADDASQNAFIVD